MKYFLLFSNRFPFETFGGMEAHCDALANWVVRKTEFKLVLISMFSKSIKKDSTESNFTSREDLISVLCSLDIDRFSFFFFNDGYWIEWIHSLRHAFPVSFFSFRSGGNDLMYAPTGNMNLPILTRRKVWVDTFNDDIDYVFVNSSFSWNNFIKCGVNSTRLEKIRGGVDSKFCRNLMKTREGRRRAFIKEQGLPDNTKILCVCARFVPFKGIDATIDAVYKLNNSLYHLVLIGDGPEKEKILGKCKRYKISHTYLGAQLQAKALECMSIADVLLNTSINYSKKSGNDFYIHTETMGRSMMEAITLGIPIVATNVGGTKELFEENSGLDIGVLCSCNVNSIAAGIVEALRLSVASKVGAKYDWTYIFQRYRKLYEENLCL